MPSQGTDETFVRPPMKPEARRRLRVFKAQHGITYTEAVNRLLDAWEESVEDRREVLA